MKNSATIRSIIENVLGCGLESNISIFELLVKMSLYVSIDTYDSWILESIRNSKGANQDWC